MAFETRYEVNTQVASSTLADRLPAICGNATFATLVSSASIKVAIVTVKAIAHGLNEYERPGAAELVARAASAALISATPWARLTYQVPGDGRCFVPDQRQCEPESAGRL
jgi:hypothetical protein